MGDWSSEHWCIIDTGLFCELAATLAPHVRKLSYYTPWEGGFPKRSEMQIGEGFEGVTRCNDVFRIWDTVDRWIFPDIYYGGMQLKLRDEGAKVWGAGLCEDLELDRIKSKEGMEAIGIPIGPWEVVTGMDDLRDYLREHPGKWVKVSRIRGNTETFFSKNYAFIESHLDEVEASLGRKKVSTEFIIEDPIDKAVELAIDSHTIDGELPDLCLVGLEVKGKAYVGKFIQKATIPPWLLGPHEALAPTLKSFQYRNWLALETRKAKQGPGYVIDPCARAGSPPFEGVQIGLTNLPDIIAEGSEGRLVEPVPAGKWVVQLVLQSDWTDKHELVLQFPKKIRPNVKLKNGAFVEGEYCIVPQGYKVTAGAVVACGDNLDDTITEVQGYAEQVKGYYLDVFEDALDEAKKELAKLPEYGITL